MADALGCHHEHQLYQFIFRSARFEFTGHELFDRESQNRFGMLSDVADDVRSDIIPTS